MTAIAAVAVPLLVGSASAATNPPWEPDVDALGTLKFFNSAGVQVTSGNNLAHLFDYAEASSADTFGGTKAEMNFAQPVPNTPTGNFPPSSIGHSTAFPNASAPAPLNTGTNPVFSGTALDANLQSFIAAQTPQTAPGFANMWQIRLYTTGPGGVGSINNPGNQTYWDADVLVDPTAGTWQEVYPEQGSTTKSTTTTLSASPANSAPQGAPVTLTATEVSPSDSTHPAGTVEFDQVVQGIKTKLGSAAVNTAGVATFTTSTLLPSAPSGPNSAKFTATFSPTASGYTGSTSASLPYTVNPVATKPTISGAHQAGKTETCNEPTPDFGVTASYAWLAGTTKIGTGAKLTVPGSAFNKELTCVASVSDGGGPVSSATSDAVKVLLGAKLTVKTKPTLSGRHRVGTTERVKHGTWSQNAKFKYQWLLNGKVIRHATKSSLKLTRADKGKKISCRVTAHATGFANGTATTSSVKVR